MSLFFLLVSLSNAFNSVSLPSKTTQMKVLHVELSFLCSRGKEEIFKEALITSSKCIQQTTDFEA